MQISSACGSIQIVAPFAGAWIEIIFCGAFYSRGRVAPFAGAWIEISFERSRADTIKLSLPSRERGLKFPDHSCWQAGLWSLPSRERGLKSGSYSTT